MFPAQDSEDNHSKHTHVHPLCIGMEIHAITDPDMKWDTWGLYWLRYKRSVSVGTPTVDGASVKSICFWPWLAELKGTNGVRPDLVSNGVLGWDSVYGFGIRALDPVLQLMVFMCILVRAGARSQVWVRVAGRNGKTGHWAGFARWLLMLWLIKRTAVMWPHIHMPYPHFPQLC